ncbi:MAG TPA: DUF1573 domain-containing protein [Chryseolinea sp.]|nr:DUF1573 domain-containing protein [Chryseolinea sp.]
MKKITLLLFLLACVATVWTQALASNYSLANMLKCAAFSWSQTTFDFGKIKQNEPVTNTFEFVNTGSEPLVISSVKASCGCTVTEYSKDPITPGGKGFVKGTYNAAKVGQFTKSITVNANTEEAVVQLTIKGEVTE